MPGRHDALVGNQWKMAVVALLTLPMGAYVVGSLVGSQAPLPDQRRPLVIVDEQSGSPTGPRDRDSQQGDDRPQKDRDTDDDGPEAERGTDDDGPKVVHRYDLEPLTGSVGIYNLRPPVRRVARDESVAD